MRLTLRTLLAYMDGILLPADAEDLRKKIEGSDFAQGLVQRIRSASTRARLGAPSIDGRGMGLDPNTVAEYLNSTLPPDREPDFERICLESDVHLAEVAGCHQILTIVEGERAQVDPDLRQRMYQIGAPSTERRAASPTDGTGGLPGDPSEAGAVPPLAGVGFEPPPVPAPPPVAESAGVAAAPVRRAKSEVPEYLRAGQRSSWKPLAITLLLAFALSAVALRAMGPFSRQHPLLRLMGEGGRAEVVDGGAATAPGSDERGGGRETPSEAAPESGPGENAPGVSVGEPTELPAEDVGQTQPSDAGMPPGQAGLPDDTPAGASGGTGGESPEPREAGPEFPATEPRPLGDPATPGAAEDASLASDEAGPGSKMPAQGPATQGPAAAVEVGYVKIKDLHFPVRLDPATQAWYRLPARSKLVSGDQLRVLPTFRPEIVLAPGVQVVFAGPSSIRLTPPTPTGEPTLLIEYGRAFVATAGVPGARLNLNLGSRACAVTFVDAASEIALEVRNFLPPGAHPERDATQHVVRAFTTIGRVEWQDDLQAASTPIVEGQVRVIVDGTGETLRAGDLPAWILREDLNEIDRGASTTLESSLVADRPITLSLKERVQDRRTEVRCLAATCLSYLDFYDALVAELDDPKQRAHWANEFAALRSAISRNPESAAAVRTSLTNRYPDVAAEAYRLLSGYSPQQLQEGADESLVQMLEHSELCIRVLAFENLRRITGLTLLYSPHYASEELRRSSVRGWRERLENRAVLYDALPLPTSERW